MSMADSRFLYKIIVIFFLSGFASLIYQVVWQRALTLYYGVGAVSVTIIVSVFMLGLGLGSIVGGWLVERSNSPIKLYVNLEIFMGLLGAVSLYALQAAIPILSQSSYTEGLVLIFLLLIAPTLLMGATLPVVVKLFNGVCNNLENSLSILYFINTLGAAIGAIIGTWFLISMFSLSIAVYIAAFINICLAIYVYTITIRNNSDLSEGNIDSPGKQAEPYYFKYGPIAIFITGFLAIGYQIVWFRFLSVFLKPSAYLFSTLLFIYLLGIALGSFRMNRVLAKRQGLELARYIQMFFILNFSIAVIQLITWLLIFWGLSFNSTYSIFEFTIKQPYHPPLDFLKLWPLDKLWASSSMFIWSSLIVLPSTYLMGASFPLIATLAIRDRSREGWGVGRLYSINVLGNLIGGLVTGFLLINYFGTEQTLTLFIAVGIVWLIGYLLYSKKALWLAKIILLISFLFGLILLPNKTQLYKLIHPDADVALVTNTENIDIKTVTTEGIDTVVHSFHATFNDINVVQVYINGQRHGGSIYTAYYERAIEALRWARNKENVLVIGYGGGYVTKTLLASTEIKNITVVELSETLIDNLRQVEHIRKDLDDSRLNLVIDDGRRFLHRIQRKYDLIIMDPIRSTTANSNNLYSKEFFELASSHLSDDGVLFTWFNEKEIIPNTFAAVFSKIRYYKKYLIGTNGVFSENPSNVAELLAAVPSTLRGRVAEWLRVMPDYIGDKNILLSTINTTVLNTDLDPNSEYYLHRNNKK